MFKYNIEVRYRDIDRLRHVSHIEFVTYMQQARLSCLEDKFNMSEHGIDPIVVHLEIDYLDSIRQGDDVVVEVVCKEPGNTSFRTEYKLLANNEVTATGHSIQVAADGDTGKKLQLPDTWRKKME